MAKKARAIFSCTTCGHQEPKWLGRCPECGAWGALVEEIAVSSSSEKAAARSPGQGGRPVPLPEAGAEDFQRRSTGITELDRVLGGGVVPGALSLIGGDPGIGKSTLMLMAAARLANEHGPVLYVSGEESVAQIRLRADRLGLEAPTLHLLAETDGEKVLAQASAMEGLCALVLDSIQTLHLPEISSAPGSVSQVRELTGLFLGWSKRRGVPTFLVGHVTKDGAIAGPRVLEHMVDTVLYFEGDRGHAYRILRAHKNRFGSAAEIGVFEMQRSGLVEVPDPSAVFLAGRPEDAPGSVVTAALSGSRPVLVEVQALCSQSPTGGSARRTAIGVENTRLALLAAVLERRLGLTLYDHDIFVNVAGGLSLDEPAADLPVACAIVSSLRGVPLDPRTILFGEVGLTGEVRAVAQTELRLSEAAKLGFKTAILPADTLARLTEDPPLAVLGVRSLDEALDAAL
ncbi:MAG: DNA repair protein RadA [Deltaproteobacteria bacterium]|nr:DNA repair protein RadA [Deltaproteobacteria bacterium]